MPATALSAPPAGNTFRNTLTVTGEGNFPTTNYSNGFDASENIPVISEPVIFVGDCSGPPGDVGPDATSSLSFSASGLPPGLSISTTGSGDGFLEGTPDDSIIPDNGIDYYETEEAKENKTFTKTFNVTVTASNGCGSASGSFPITILKNWDNDKEALLKFVEDTYG